MCLHGMSYLPILLVVLSTATFISTYIIAIYKDDVSADFPYISDTGTKPPESCIFGQFLNISAAICLCTVYVRYKLVESLSTTDDQMLRCLNKWGLALGIITSLGLSIVANFQETLVEPVHIAGAGLVFGVGVVYAALQTRLTYYMHPDYNGLYIARIRLTLTLVSLVVMVLTFICAAISRRIPPKDKLHWKPDEPGYVEHIVSTVGEWITAITFLLYFLTFVRDFTKIKIEVKSFVAVRHLDDPVYPNEQTRLIA
ncbi:DNA damage-regulated autophagy modulator protein 2-like [Dreissena polymorpha]|uniref:CWH43-like N-terminal domain-containing protein n=1 Tax=Dreissena polymorpha TaxID=45954 RepID=A0A9D4S1L3_DREPO|nr:DNA damage-regulated autophagy modulator protein 2-like [Dreissena polymorpha]XP_052228241.1 DNA damage-regulated autophagy modulator protein 2-like [Dreissena polymorpha]XP_052228246.1 DNA damage-regulated autophagy modulator protein 2-like [Dreissena polymorpha]KAH3886517.1 hypothetical protein DPMN_010528 [Dreissena polymorpha]